MRQSSKALANVSNDTKLDLTVCAQQFYQNEWHPGDTGDNVDFIEEITWSLARDDKVGVREELAKKLCTCRHLPLELAEEIASDVESVATPFLAETDAFTDKQMANLVPFLKQHAISALAKRPDIKSQTIYAIAVTGGPQSATLLAVNKFIVMGANAARKIVERFEDNQYLLDMLALRLDLPIDVVHQIIDLVSSFARYKLTENYAIKGNVVAVKMNVRSTDWIVNQLKSADPGQVHSIVINMRQRGELYHFQALEVAEQGCFAFLESTLALEAGETLGYVREVFALKNTKEFVQLLQKAGINKNLGAAILHAVKQHNSLET